MKVLQKIILFLLTINLGYGQVYIDQHFIENIDNGYTTRWDVEQTLGQGEYLESKVLSPDVEHDFGKHGLYHYNGLFYKNLGVTFKCADDGELISGIQFRKPFKGTFETDDTIEIGITKLDLIFPQIDTFKVNTSGASSYWSFKFNEYTFYVEKPSEHKNKTHWSHVPPFKENLEYYKNEPISIIEIELYDYDRFETKPIEKEENLLCTRPIYAPKEENHLNCYKLGYPKKLTWIEIPIYALTGGGKSEKIKQGYWKEYGPNHKLTYEGEFKNDKEVGLFKYYNQDGNIIRTEKFSESTINWVYISITVLLMIFLMILIRRKKQKTTHDT